MNENFIPIHRDPEWQELDKLDQKVFATYRAFRKTEDEIKKLEKIDLETAINAASKYASYSLQLRILANDQTTLRCRLEGYQENKQVIETHNNWRLELESAIKNAQLGNYIPLKSWFNVCQSRQEYQVLDIDLQDNLDKIISIIPDKYDPFIVQPIAWQQPEFQKD